MSTIESVLNETRLFPPPEAFARQANVSGMAAYQALCDEAARDYEGFWARLAREQLLWHKPFSKVLDERNAPFFKWFEDGELNVSTLTPVAAKGLADVETPGRRSVAPSHSVERSRPPDNCCPSGHLGPPRRASTRCC